MFYNTTTNWFITATPPTPNGDLHIGHLAGPYLAADVFKRARLALGDTATYICYGDDNQSYVASTAERLNCNARDLMDCGNQEIMSTLRAYDIEMDAYTRPDHTYFIQSIFQKLYRKGALIEKNVPMFYDFDHERFLFEPYIQGNCPVCLQHTKGGICEDCGHPNEALDLINPSIVGKHGLLEIRSVKRLVLPLEHYREKITAFYADKKYKWRPHLLRLVNELLSKPLPDFPMTHPTDWGIPVGMLGWEGHVWNAWAEMGPGLLYALQRKNNGAPLNNGCLVQFLGFDNAYFFAIIHLAIQFALAENKEADTLVPEYIITNEFFHLQNKKFSTSEGHAIWGRELLKHVSPGEARLYLALKSPELAKDNFVFSDMEEVLNKVFRKPVKQIFAKISTPSDLTYIPPAKANKFPWILNIRKRFEHFCHPEYFSTKELAELFIAVLEYVATLPGDTIDQYHEFICGVDLLFYLATPIMPRFKDKFIQKFSDRFVYFSKQQLDVYG